jgi:glycosyltransferase involved in cell wall biosynthesis
MKIAFIGQKGIPTKQGGIEKHVEELTKRLAGFGFNITVYSRSHYTEKRDKKYTYEGVTIINIPSINTKHLDAITHTLFSTLHALTQDYDVIHYHGVGPSLLSFIPRIFKPSVKVINTFHCIDRYHQKWGRLAKLILALGEYTACKFPHQTITISKILEKYSRSEFNSKAKYIPNGASITHSQNNKILKELDLEAKDYIVTVSRLVRHKGIHTLIKAYNQTTQTKKLVIVGDGANTDDYVKEVKSLAGNNKNIIFAGRQSGDNLYALFENAYLFAQPSEAEGLSIALLEAMLYEVPMIISNIEENQEPAGGCALEFINKSIEDLKRKLQYALDNPEIMEAFAKKAKIRAQTEYNWDDITKETALTYQELTNHLVLNVSELK